MLTIGSSWSLREATLDIRRAFLPLWEAAKLGAITLLRSIRGQPLDYPKLLRSALERLGVTYLKLGQYLAMRRDFLPAELCEELSRLYESASHLDFNEIKKVIESELNGPLDQFFAAFEENAIAAASIAQVHEAKTLANERVAVKIQRPGIKPVFDADIRNLHRAAAIAYAVGISGTLPLKEIVEEFAKWTSKEFDFVIEGRTAERLRHNATPNEVVPVVFWNLSTAKVLTMELIDGMSLAQIIALVRQGREDLVHARLPSLDFEAAGHNMALASLHQFFVCGFFHGDPHPGNVFILEDNSVAFVDFGIFGELTDYLQEILTGYIESVAVGNLSGAVRYFSKLCSPTELTDYQEFLKDLSFNIHHWYQASKRPASTFEDRHIGKYLGDVLGSVRRNHLRMEIDSLLFWRALSALDYSALSMSKHFELLYELRLFFEQIRPGPIERLINVITDRRFETEVIELTPRVPGYFSEIISRSLEGEGPGRFLVMRESKNRSELRTTRCLTAVLVGVSLVIAGQGSHFGMAAVLSMLTVAAILFSFSMVEARLR
jgi:ubiquinone biosynthesis protein